MIVSVKRLSLLALLAFSLFISGCINVSSGNSVNEATQMAFKLTQMAFEMQANAATSEAQLVELATPAGEDGLDSEQPAVVDQQAPVVQQASSFGTPQLWTQAVCHQGCYLADVTGDGKADLIVHDNNGMNVMPSIGTEFAKHTNWTGGQALYYDIAVHFADVTGDGKADLIVHDNNGMNVMPSTGTEFAKHTNWTGGQALYYDIAVYFADVTGDGKADLIVHDNDGLNVMPSTGTEFARHTNWTGGPVACDYGCYFMDATGDGRADFIAHDKKGTYVLPAQ